MSATVCAALVAACASPTEPTEFAAQRFLVHSVLDLGANEQLVFIERTVRDPVLGNAVRGATVTITTPAGSLAGVEDTARTDVGLYRVPSVQTGVGIRRAGNHELRIITADGDTITGNTTMPDASPVGLPPLVPVFMRDTDTLRLEWPRVPGARGYQVVVYLEPGVAFLKTYSVFADTAVSIPGRTQNIETGDDAFPRSARVAVVVAAVDDNYFTYYQAAIGPFTGAPPSRLTGGAIGVFGSLVPVLVRRYEVR